MKIAISLDSQKWQYIANVLSQRPYAEVKDTLEEIEAQFDAQKAPPSQEVKQE